MESQLAMDRTMKSAMWPGVLIRRRFSCISSTLVARRAKKGRLNPSRNPAMLRAVFSRLTATSTMTHTTKMATRT
ncbi:MAG: hypothetical protein A4E61_00126 [Syntrophorhabdus sp. PtaB.Bin184]|nr:MAG: hypothetical protein A4E61_00126 [Syntrophorhabdus sp. PtaB.Bin184]